MSFDTSLYTRDRPLLDETQSMHLTRKGDPTWEREEWLFGKMSVTVEPYAFDPDSEDPIAEAVHDDDDEDDEDDEDHEDDEDQDDVKTDSSWPYELRWVVQVSGRHPDDEFFTWFARIASNARGVIWNENANELEHGETFEPRARALDMLDATRPIHCDWDDRTTDLIRRTDPPVDPWSATQANVYGASLADLVAAGVRLSWDAIQYVMLAIDPADAPPLQFSIYDVAIRGRAEARALVELTTHPDPRIDALLRDPARASELSDAIGTAAVDPLLGAILGHELQRRIPLRDSAAIRDELVAFWERVIQLDPRLDASKRSDVQRPRMS